jgi:hypothetical protein
MKNLFYTFRTNPFKDDLKKELPNLIVLGNLKEDLQTIRDKLINEKLDFIIGFAKSNRSCFEKIAVNNFNNKNIAKGGKEEFSLFVPRLNLFNTSVKPTNSFCNWSMYKISGMIEKEKLDSKLIFVHFREEDYPDLIKFAKEMK